MSKLNFVSCVCWVPKGVSKSIPEKCQLSQEQMRSKIHNDKRKLKELNANVMETEPAMDVKNSANTDNEDDIVHRYNLNNYDSDENNDDFIIPDDNDPFINREQNYSDEEEEKEDFQIRPEDNLILAGHVEEDCVSLEIKVYNQHDSFYVHHEIYLAAYPLCFQWLDFKNNSLKGNLVAVGDMNNDIHIWDLDIVDSLEPFAVLYGHRNSVLDLSWNKNTPERLASGSADKKCLLWDLHLQRCIQEFDIFKSNVQSIEFHPIETNILLTGDSNGNAKVINCQTASVKNWKVDRVEVENIAWNRNSPYSFLCATSDGYIYSFDCRQEGSPLFSNKAHDGMISGIEFSIEDYLITGSADKTTKIWKLNEQKPKIVHQFDPNVGTILSMSCNPDHPSIVAISGDNVAQNFNVIDITKFIQK